jgi:hypothetical protein
MTWDDVRTQLRAKLMLAADTETLVALVWKLGEAEGRPPMQQAVFVSPVVVYKLPWLWILGEVCNEKSLSATDAVLHQSRLGFGALIIRKGEYFLRHTLALEHLAFDDLERAIRMVAQEAYRLRMSLGNKGDPGVFTTFEE